MTSTIERLKQIILEHIEGMEKLKAQQAEMAVFFVFINKSPDAHLAAMADTDKALSEQREFFRFICDEGAAILRRVPDEQISRSD